MTTTLRDYQIEMRDALIDYCLESDRNGIVVSPTGTGKSLVCNAFIRWAVEEIQDCRVLCVTHDAKIIAQNCDSMIRFWPECKAGIYSAGLKQYNTTADVVYCGIQSAYKCPEEFGFISAVIIDECHMVSPKEGTMYGKLLKGLWQVNPEIKVIGFSATPYRMGQGLLTEGDLFDDIVIDLSVTERFVQFVEEGYLSPLVTKKTSAEIDLQHVSIRLGDFDEKEMQQAADKDSLNKAVVQECIKYGADRSHWLGFCSGLVHAEHLKDAFTSHGIEAEVVHGTQSMEEREAITQRFREGRLRVILNVGIFNVGWDFPELDLIFVVRGTQSCSWWVQCLGRGTRAVYQKGMPLETVEQRLAAIKAGPKPNGCRVLDFAGNCRRLGPINSPIVPVSRKKGDNVGGCAPVKECPMCSAYNHTRAKVCIDCGYEFPPASCIEKTAGTDEVFIKQSVTPVIDILQPNVVHYATQPAKDTAKGELAKVSYSGMIQSVSEYYCPEAPEEWLRRKFSDFWIKAGGSTPVPSTAANFLERARNELKTPSSIHFVSNKKYPEIREKHYN